MTIRVYLFGITGLNPLKVNSFRNLIDSELVRASEYPEVWYELKPDQNTIFRWAPFRTKSRGLGEIIGTIKYKALRYDLDMILVTR